MEKIKRNFIPTRKLIRTMLYFMILVDDRKYTPSHHVHLGCKVDCFNRKSYMFCVVIVGSIKSAFEEIYK